MNRRETHSTIDEFNRVRMPKLVERAGNPCLRAVLVPAFLHRLVAQRPSSPVLLRPEQGSVFVDHPFQVGSEKLYQTWRLLHTLAPDSCDNDKNGSTETVPHRA